MARYLAWWIYEFIPRLVALVKSAFGPRSQFFSELANFREALYNMPIFGGLYKLVGSLFSWLRNSLGPAIGDAFKWVGQMIISGWLQGIWDNHRMIWEALRDIAESAWKAVTKVFRPGSPSKTMRWLGQMISQGLALGIRDSMPDVERAVSRLNTAASAQPEIRLHRRGLDVNRPDSRSPVMSLRAPRSTATMTPAAGLERAATALEKRMRAVQNDPLEGRTIVLQSILDGEKVGESVMKFTNGRLEDTQRRGGANLRGGYRGS
jgi:hypothetical protein